MADSTMAMIVGDDMLEDSATSLSLNDVKSKQIGDVLSPEDITWADSCLSKDAEISVTNWSSLIDAFAESLTFQADTLGSLKAERDVLIGGSDMEISLSNGETKTSESPEKTFHDIASSPFDDESDKNSDIHLIDETTDTLRPTEYLNAFLPTYKEDVTGVDNSDADFDSTFPVFAMEPTTEIFKVWDLDIPAEEDEFVKQLKKALVGDTSRSVPSDLDDSGVSKEMRGETVADLIAGTLDLSLDDIASGISDLSLSEKSG